MRGAGVIEPRSGPIEYSIDRFGGDYRNLRHRRRTRRARLARRLARPTTRCRAWTYVRPGYISTGARCYLKDKLSAPRHKPCCISGVVR